jgi:putative phosphoesterase
MRIAILSDVHGNLPALEAFLDRIRKEKLDSIYHLGDMIAIGPFPAECLDLWSKTPHTISLMGNHESFLVNGLPDPLPPSISPGEADHHRWVFSCIDPALRKMVSGWPFSLKRSFGDLKIAFLHYALDETGRGYLPFMKDISPSNLDALFGKMDVDLILYGHDHRESDIMGRARYLNPGSLGCHDRAIARYMILEIDEDSTYRITKHSAPYDDHSIFDELERRSVPDRETIRRCFFPRSC